MAGFGATASILIVVSVIALGPAAIRSYANLLIDMVRNPDNPAYGSMRFWGKMPTIKGLFATILAGRIATVHISALAAAVSLPLLLLVAWRWRQADQASGGNSQALMFAAALAISQVTAPHLFTYDLTLMLLAVPLVICSPQWSHRSRQRLVLVAVIMILYAPPVYILLARWKAMGILATILVAFAVAAMGLARRVELPAG